MNKVIHAFGIPSSPLHVSTALSHLGISHSVVNGVLRTANNEIHVAKKQPAWPVVLPSVSYIPRNQCDRENQILFVCGALAQLTTCNMPIIRLNGSMGSIMRDLAAALDYALAHPIQGWKLQQKVPSIHDYVTHATKPSFLNDLQNLIYKITPYDLQKQVRILIIEYLAGKGSRTALVSKLKSSHKLTGLLTLIQSPKTAELCAAVELFRKTKSIEQVCLQTGFESFEILYIASSSQKMTEEKKKKKS